MNHLNFEYLDLSCNYGACLWINGKAVKPEDLPISEQLCQQVNSFCDDYSHNALDNESDEWWDNHCKEKIEIAKLLQQELPAITIRLFAYNDWVSLAMYQYQIEIMDGFEKGSNFWIGACKKEELQNPENSYFEHISKLSGVSIDEDIFLYAYWFLNKYFDKSIQANNSYYCNEFEWWGNNYYTYEQVKSAIGEMREMVYLLISKQFQLNKVIEWKNKVAGDGFDYLFMEKFYPSLNWRELNREEQYRFIEKHSYIYINFYNRLIQKMEKMMKDNPNCDLICFSGP